MRFSVTYDIVGISELPLDYRAGFVGLVKSALEKSNYSDQSIEHIYRSTPICFAVRFNRKPEIKDGKILIGKNITLYISSPSLTLVTAIYNGLISIKEYAIYKMKVTNPSASYIKEYAIQESNIIFATLSPIVIRNCQKKEKYILPGEDRFMESLLNSIYDEWRLYNDTKLEAYGDVKFNILKSKKAVMKHYGGLVLGFTGILQMTAAPSILKFLYQSGIGYRRGNGFGFVKVDTE